MRTARLRAAVGVLCGLLLAAGCGGGDDTPPAPSPASPTPSSPVAVPSGVRLTVPGTVLRPGHAASAAYVADARRRSIVTVGVTRIVQGSIADLRTFALDRTSARSTPYYVSASVHNAGPGALGGARVPLYGFDSHSTYFVPTRLVGSFPRCPGGALPTRFAVGARVSRCLVFLVPEGATLSSVQLRTPALTAPISWRPR